MDTKTYLLQIERLDKKIKNKLSEINQLNEMATSITIVPKDVNVQTSGEIDRLGSSVSELVDLETEANELIKEFIRKRKKIINQIDCIPDTNMYNVLSGRYILRKKLEVIAVEMGYSFKQILRIHKNALKEFEKQFGEEYIYEKKSQNVP